MLKVAPGAASTSNGTVTSVATGTGLPGGPITTTGTISMVTISMTLGNTNVSLGNTITNIGNLTLVNANISATSNANATFATSSLLLIPKGYITILVNGTNQKIPYYDV